MVVTAIAVTPAKLGVRYVRARAEHLPFTHEVFDLVFATLSLRHWTNLSAGSPRSAACSTANTAGPMAEPWYW